MKNLIIRKLKIQIKSNGKDYGCSYVFERGLNVLRGDNSSGKSTLANAIIYCLGLEILLGMKGPQSMTPALRERFEYDNQEFKVDKSYIEMEIKNHQNKTVTLRRQIKGGKKDHKLVQVKTKKDTSLSKEDIKPQYFFLHDPGSAQREHGFHNYLANFLDLDLPIVQTYKYNEVLLYIECLFSLFFVEQYKGWSDILATLPTQFGIKDMGKRVIEYVMGLEVYKNEKKREKINKELYQLQEKWNNSNYLLRSFTKEIRGILSNQIKKIPKELSLEKLPKIVFSQDLDKYITIEEKKESLIKKIKEIEEKPIIKKNYNDYKQKLKELDLNLYKKEINLRNARTSYYQEENNKKLLNEKISDIENDIRRNKDILKLQILGAELDDSINFEKCPVCQQVISRTLLDPEIDFKPMTIEENINYLEQQRENATLLLRKTIETSIIKESLIEKYEEEVNDLRRKIREINNLLIEPEAVPDFTKFKEKIKLEEKLEKINKILKEFDDQYEILIKIVDDYNQKKEELNKLPDEIFSSEDKNKINALQSFYISNLKQLGLGSTKHPDIEISMDNYLPIHKKFLKSRDLSATDQIRKIWSYYLSHIQLSVNFKTNHLNFCIFDEPGQQHINIDDLKEFYNKIMSFNLKKTQIFVITSEDIKNLSFLEGKLNTRIFEIEDRLIKPI